jgi:hypothetical protein
VSAMGKADNAVSDSSEGSTTATPDKVSGPTLASCLSHHAFSIAEKGWLRCVLVYLVTALQQVQQY